MKGFQNFPHPMAGPPGHFPGMIGGEYDLR